MSLARPKFPGDPAPEDHRAAGLRDGLDGLRDLMDRLLHPEHGCPWDRAQTPETLRPYALEEVHEVLESMDDPAAHRRELGDLLFQIVFHAALREREGRFDLDDVVEAIRSKMIRRHPHVFDRDPDAPPPDEATLARQWSEMKARERELEMRAEGEAARPPNPLDGVPRGLGNLQRAWRLQDKAAAVGFDWPDLNGVRSKLQEELEELKDAVARGHDIDIRDELGDVLFVLVRYAQKLGVEPEGALRRANRKFIRRFSHVVNRCHEEGIELQEAGLETMESFWREAKRDERREDATDT